ncbi:MAG TPA: hypothetical protein VLC92_18010 [Rhodocyclaceae bacterium]|nr:hypothetical protein [Rhodocyclaceae bacterium]
MPLVLNGAQLTTKFICDQRDCVHLDKCLCHSARAAVRQITFYRGRADPEKESFTDRMKRAIDSERGRALHGRRFANLKHLTALAVAYGAGLDASEVVVLKARDVDSQCDLAHRAHKHR